MKIRAKTFITNNYFLYTLGIIFIFLLWLFLSSALGKASLIIPSPIETFKVFGELFVSKYTWESIGWTLLRTLIGFGIAFVIAFILGIIGGNNKYVYTFLKPFIAVLKSIPTAALVFLFLILSGSRFAPTYIVFLLSFPILYESIAGGIRSIPQEINESLRLDSNNIIRPIMQVRIPLAMPYIIVGLASSFALSLKTEIMAEIITGDTNYGLGSMISAYRTIDPSDLTPIFAIALIALIIILITDVIGMVINKVIKIDK